LIFEMEFDVRDGIRLRDRTSTSEMKFDLRDRTSMSEMEFDV